MLNLKVLERLNGWQRAWLVTACAWLVIIVSWVAHNFPTRESWIKQGLYDNINSNSGEDEKDCNDLSSPEDVGRSMTCVKKQLMEQAARNEENRQYRKYFFEHLDETVEEMQIAQAERAFLWWILPCAILYVSGIATSWVRKGFERR
jgi:hypothetical protein